MNVHRMGLAAASLQYNVVNKRWALETGSLGMNASWLCDLGQVT